MNITEFKAIVTSAKTLALSELGKHGINDSFCVRVVDKPKYRFVGEYKALSQFGGNGPTFRIFSSIVTSAKEIRREDRKCGLIPSTLHSLTHEGTYETILHEYGHVIYEYLSKRHPRYESFILKTWGDEEAFAEYFKDYVTDPQMSEFAKEFEYVLKKWRTCLN